MSASGFPSTTKLEAVAVNVVNESQQLQQHLRVKIFASESHFAGGHVDVEETQPDSRGSGGGRRWAQRAR